MSLDDDLNELSFEALITINIHLKKKKQGKMLMNTLNFLSSHWKYTNQSTKVKKKYCTALEFRRPAIPG